MKSPLYDYADIKELTANLESITKNILKKNKEISFKECLLKASREIPELDSDSMEMPPSVKNAQKTIIQKLEHLITQKKDEKTREKLDSIKQTFSTDNIIQKKLLEGFKLRIWGAGSCGLSCAYLFSCHGAQVELNEKRGEQGPLSACSRTPNISWKNFEKTMISVLDKQDFNRLFQSILQYGGVIDPQSGKLRSSIGAFQEALYKQISANQVKVNLNQKMELKNIHDNNGFSMQVISTGVHAKDEILLDTHKPLLFPGGQGEIDITTTMYPTNLDIGFYRDQWEEGESVSPYGRVSWRRKNINVQSVDTFRGEIKRFVFNLEKRGFTKKDIEKGLALTKENHVAHVFYFGNHRSSYHHGIGEENYPCITEKVQVGSWMFNKFIDSSGKTPIALLGDATGPSHPLAAIGAYLSSKNSVDLFKYCTLIHNLNSIKDVPVSVHDQILKDALFCLEGKMLLDRLMVFLQARLCSHYSR